MTLAIVILILFLVFITLLKFIKNLKTLGIIAMLFFIFSTAFICIKSPQMHKPFSIDVIEYLIKINSDGSLTTTKQITKTVITKDKTPDKTEAEK